MDEEKVVMQEQENQVQENQVEQVEKTEEELMKEAQEEMKKALKEYANNNTGTVFVDESGEIIYMTRTYYKKKSIVKFNDATYVVTNIKENILHNGCIQSVMTVKPYEEVLKAIQDAQAQAEAQEQVASQVEAVESTETK